jgi:hypothetical protein
VRRQPPICVIAIKTMTVIVGKFRSGQDDDELFSGIFNPSMPGGGAEELK